MKTNKNFKQVCVWQWTTLWKWTVKDFENFIKEKLNSRIKFIEEITTNPWWRTDLFFYIHTDDIMKFAVPRLWYWIRWLEDVYWNWHWDLYPSRIADLLIKEKI